MRLYVRRIKRGHLNRIGQAAQRRICHIFWQRAESVLTKSPHISFHDRTWKQAVEWSNYGFGRSAAEVFKHLRQPVTAGELIAASLNRNPLGACGEKFLLRIERHDVGAQSADATIWTKGDFRHQAGVVLV